MQCQRAIRRTNGRKRALYWILSDRGVLIGASQTNVQHQLCDTTRALHLYIQALTFTQYLYYIIRN